MAGTPDEPDFASNGPIALAYTDDGDPQDPPLVLIAGVGNQLIAFEDEFVQGLVDRAFRVIRIDNRDAGLSTMLDTSVTLEDYFASVERGEPIDPPYTLSDMASDVIAILDHLGVDRAHLLGMSMGGMVVQIVGLDHPQRVQSLTLLSTTTGAPDVGQPTAEALEALTSPSPDDRASVIERNIAVRRVWATPEYFDEDWLREYFGRCFDRSHSPAGAGRQMVAIAAAPNREDDLGRIDVPTLVLHGTEDTLIAPTGGERLAELIAGAELVLLDGLGHDLPPHYWAPVIEAVTQLAIRSLSAA